MPLNTPIRQELCHGCADSNTKIMQLEKNKTWNTKSITYKEKAKKTQLSIAMKTYQPKIKLNPYHKQLTNI